jgi:hypothetical protein
VLRWDGSLTAAGDPSGTVTVVATGIPASLVEDAHRTWDGATQTPRTVRTLSALVGYGTDVRKGDQFRDDTHAITYVVKDVTQERSFAVPAPDLSLDLAKVGGGD